MRYAAYGTNECVYVWKHAFFWNVMPMKNWELSCDEWMLSVPYSSTEERDPVRLLFDNGLPAMCDLP